MTEAEWRASDDAGAMLEFLWRQRGEELHGSEWRFGGNVRSSEPHDSGLAELERALHRYYLASCRGIWKLLPQEASRRGVEMAEEWLAGAVTDEELNRYNWHVEGAAFCIDYDTAPAEIDRWAAEVRAIPAGELRAMLHPRGWAGVLDPRELLKQAAYFADFAMVYPSLRPRGVPPPGYRRFLSAAVLKEYVPYPDVTPIATHE